MNYDIILNTTPLAVVGVCTVYLFHLGESNCEALHPSHSEWCEMLGK